MSELRFSSNHEWVRVEDDIAVVGITDYAQEQLGDIVFVELPALGASLAKADQAAVVESVKAANELYAPVGGEVTEVNEALADAPEAVNADPLGGGWFFKLRLADAGELDALMDEDAYKAFVEGLD